MRRYPILPLSKQDFLNLLSMPEHSERARADLKSLAALDDEYIDYHSDETKLDTQKIPNPLPAWKRSGFSSKSELLDLVSTEKTR